MHQDKSNVAHYSCFCTAAPLVQVGYDSSLMHGVETGT